MTMTLGQALSVIDRSIRTLREAGYPEQADELIEARRPVSAQFAQPAQSVDVEKVREVILQLRAYQRLHEKWPDAFPDMELEGEADKLTAALQEKGK